VVNAPESIPAPAVPSGARTSRDVTATRRFVAVAGFLSVAAAVALALAEASGHQLDFDIYRMGATQVTGRHLYSARVRIPGMHGPGMRFTYPPFAALLFCPFTWLSVSGGQFGWAIFNVVVLAAIAGVTLHVLRPDWSYRRIGAIVAIALFPALRLSPALLTLDLGQVNLLIALLVLADLTCVVGVRSRALPRGVLVGIAAAVKLTPLIFIPFLLLTRQFRAACTALGTFLLCSLGAALIAPHSSELYWTRDVFDSRRSGNLMYISDQNAHSALQRILGAPPSPLLAGALTLALAAAGLAVATWAYRASSPMLGILLCATTGLMVSPITWSHHYVWVLPVIGWLALGADRPRGGLWWALGVAILFWAAPIWWIPAKDQQWGYGGPLVLLAGNSYFLAAVAFPILAALLLWTRRSVTAPAEPGAGRPAVTISNGARALRHIGSAQP